MPSDVWVGIDLGTQSVRAVAVDDTGSVLATARRPLDSRRGDSRHEQDPRQWRTASTAALRAVTGTLGTARTRIRGVATCGTSGTITALGPGGEPVSPGIMYDDGRAVAHSSAALSRASEWLAAELGYRVQPTWALPKLAAPARGGEFPAGARLAHQPDVVNAMLAGHPVATDTSSALKTGADPRVPEWPEPVAAAVGDRVTLPELALPGTPLGVVTAAAAETTGLPRGTTVVAGMTDGCAAQLAAGALDAGDWNCVLGTTLVCKGVSEKLVSDPDGATYSHLGPGGHWLPGAASSTGLGVLAELFPGTDLDALTRSGLRALPPVCYPLAVVGERFPFAEPDAAGFVLDGATRLPVTATTRDTLGESTMLGALLAGIAYTERLCFEVLAAAGYPTGGRLRFSGGATRNPLLTALRATVLGRAVEVPETAEPAAGMAVLAAWAVASGAGGSETPAERAAAMVRVGATVEPGSEPSIPDAAELDDGYQRFRCELRTSGWLPDTVEGDGR